MKINKKFVRTWAVLLAFAVAFAFLAPFNVATVEAKTYHIKAWAAAGGGITDEGTKNVKGGKDITYHIYPDSGHVVNYVMVDGENIGAVNEYTFHNVDRDHEIYVYFITEAARNVVNKKNLTVVGSYSLTNGTGSYQPNAKVTIDAGIMPGFRFAGWLASDGKIYPSAQSVITMPDYDVILYANWTADGAVGGLSQIATTNLKGDQVYGWTGIADKLVTFSPKDTQDGKSATMNVSVSGFNCYVDAATIAVLNARQGIALNVSYGADVSFTFLSDIENIFFTGTELSYTSTTTSAGFAHVKNIYFAEQGVIGTSVFANVYLPEAVTGQNAYVYLIDEKGNELAYMTAVVDGANRISVPLAAKINFKVTY